MFMSLGITEVILLLFLFCVPLFLIALVNILKSEFKGNDKLVWLLVVIFVPFIGPLCYLIIGKRQRIAAGNRENPTLR